jgi:hypothetical protein
MHERRIKSIRRIICVKFWNGSPIIRSNGSMNCYPGILPRSGQGWISEMLPEGDCSRVRNRLQAVLTGRLLNAILAYRDRTVVVSTSSNSERGAVSHVVSPELRF